MKKYLLKIIYLIFFISIITSCSNEKDLNELEEINENYFIEYESKEVDEYNPEIYKIIDDTFAWVISSDMNEDYLVFIDCILNKCFVYDINFNLVTSFGSDGEAPGELNIRRGGARVCINKINEIVIYDSGNNRIQLFSIEGEFIKSIQIGMPIRDFIIFNNLIIATTSSYNTSEDIVIIDINKDRIVEKIILSELIDFKDLEFPLPERFIESNKDGIVYTIKNDVYKIFKFEVGDSIIRTIEINDGSIKYSVEMLEKIEKYAPPAFKDKIRDTYLLCFNILNDRVKGNLWVMIPPENENFSYYDIFTSNGNYVKRVKLSNINWPLVISDGKIVQFDNSSGILTIYDVSSVYE